MKNGCCSYKVEGDEQTASAELRGLRVVTQINLGGAESAAPTANVRRHVYADA